MENLKLKNTGNMEPNNPSEDDTFEHLKCRIVTDEFSTIRYYNTEGKIHREDGPAVIDPNSGVQWLRNGIRHRDNGPAIIYAGGDEFWYNNGKLHREDGPAIIRSDGRKEWWEHGRFIRE